MSERFPMEIPFGWFFLAYADELAPGEVKPLKYFDRNMVLFRGEDGGVGLLDAYCLHLGAHLGHGGKVEGNTLSCPFHGWKFNRKGHCTEIPYARKMPPKLADGRICQKHYPVVEKNKVIWGWYHPEDAPPEFDVMDHEEIGHPDWVDLIKHEWTFASNPQEIAENGVDVAHFQFVHGMDAVPEGETTYDGYVRYSMAEGPKTVTHPDGSKEIRTSKVRTVQNGAGQKYTRISGLTDTLLMVLVTPVTREECEVRFAFTHKRVPEDSLEYKAARGTIKTLTGQTGVEGDIPIWHHKRFNEFPLLCDGDGPIMRFRKYFSQFYVNKPAQAEG